MLLHAIFPQLNYGPCCVIHTFKMDLAPHYVSNSCNFALFTESCQLLQICLRKIGTLENVVWRRQWYRALIAVGHNLSFILHQIINFLKLLIILFVRIFIWFFYLNDWRSPLRQVFTRIWVENHRIIEEFGSYLIFWLSLSVEVIYTVTPFFDNILIWFIKVINWVFNYIINIFIREIPQAFFRMLRYYSLLFHWQIIKLALLRRLSPDRDAW